MHMLTSADYLTFLIGLSIAYFILIYIPKLSDKNWVQRRLDALNSRSNLGWQAEQDSATNSWIERALKQIWDLFHSLSLFEINHWRQLLSVAGFRTQRSLAIFLVAKIFLMVLLTLAGFGFVLTSRLMIHEPFLGVSLIVLSLLVGFRLPDIIIDGLGKRRRVLIENGVPDMLDIMMICLEAGLGFDATLEKLVQEMTLINKPLAEELNLLLIELMFTPDRRHALMNFYKRTEAKPIHTLVTILVQSERYGTSLNEALKTLANESRQQRMLEAEAKAARLPATLTIPLVILILPCLFIVILGPVFISL